MRNITAQYRDLLEGKISKANFMTNVRRTFPDYITATNNFEDAIKILKNKRILKEAILSRYNEGIDRSLLNAEKAAEIVAQANPSITSDDEALQIVADMMEKAGISNREITGAVNDPDWPSEFITALKLELAIVKDKMEKGAEQDFIPEAKSSKKHKPDTKEEISEKEVKAKLESKHDGKQLEAALKVFRKIDISKFKTVGEAVKEIEANAKKQFPTAFESDEEPKGKKSLKEAAEKSEGSYKKVTGKDLYSIFNEIDRVNPYELRKGITMEMGMQYLPTPNTFTDHFNPDTLAKATKKALKNLQEDPAYYTNKISMTTEKRTNMLQKPKEMKVGPDGSTKIKGFTADKSNTQTNLGKKEKGSKSPDGVKEMKPSKRSMGGIKIMKSNGKLPKGVELMQEADSNYEKGTMGYIDPKILKQPNQTGAKAGKPFRPGQISRDRPKSVTDPIIDPETLGKLKKLEEYIMAEVKKALKEVGMKEGAVGQTVTGATVVSGKNPQDVIKKALDLEKQTGDQITVVDTKTGTKKDV